MTMTNTLDEPRVEQIDPADVLATDAANPADREDIGFLMGSLKEIGQQIPALVSKHPTIEGKYLSLDGMGRAYCQGLLGRKLLAIVVDGEMPEADRIVLKFSSNVLRRTMELPEIAADATRYMELTGATQVEAAAKLKVSETTISRALALIRKIPAEQRAAARELGPHFVSLIAPLREPAKMQDAIAFAKTPTTDGKKPTREAVTEYVATLRDGKKPGGGKPRRLKFTVEGRAYEVELKPDDTPATLAAGFKAVAKRIESKGKKSIEAVITDLMRGDQPAAPAASPAERPAVAEQAALANP